MREEILFFNMLYIIGCLIVINLEVITTSNVSAPCHSQCDCLSHSTAGVSVNCSSRDFTSVPNDLPSNSSILLLNNNHLQTVSPKIISNYPLLRKIDLRNNNIKCNCSMGWIFNTGFNLKIIGRCGSPPTLKGRNISNVSKHEMCTTCKVNIVPSSMLIVSPKKTFYFVNDTINMSCPGGYVLNGSATLTCPVNGRWDYLLPKCQDDDECTTNQSVCHVNATCSNTEGSYKCVCNEGFVADGELCRDKDECKMGENPCSNNAVCVNTKGSYKCSCNEGFVGDGKNCTEVLVPPTSAPPAIKTTNTTLRSTAATRQVETSTGYTNISELITSTIRTSTASTIPTKVPKGGLNLTHLIEVSNKTQSNVESLRNILQMLEDKVSKWDKSGQKGVEGFLRIASNLMKKENGDSWVRTNQNFSGVERLLQTVNKALSLQAKEMIRNHVNGSKELPIRFDNINADILVGKADVIAKQNLEFPRSRSQQDDYITFPRTDFQNAGDKKIAVVVISYSQLENILPKRSLIEKFQSFRMNSHVLSSSVLTLDGDFTTSVTIKFKKKGIDSEAEKSSKCVFWKYGKKNLGNNSSSGGWLDEGCRVSSENKESTICKCKHLTEFAVLTGDIILLSRPLLIVYIASLFLLVALVIAFVRNIIIWRQTRRERLFVLCNQCLALVCTMVVFLLGLFLHYNQAMCTAFGVLLHWLVLSVFLWILVEVLQLYFAVRFGSSRSNTRNKYFLILAWVLPMVFVGVMLAVTKVEIYGSNQWCWFNESVVLHLTYACPIALCILIGLSIVLKVTCLKAEMTDENDKKDVGVVLWLCTFFSLLVVATWATGALSASQPEKQVFQYLFAIFCILLAIYILVYHFLLDREITKMSLKTDSRARPKRDYYSTKETVMYSEGTPEGKKISVIFPSRKSPPHGKKPKGEKRGTKRNESVNPFDYDPAVTMYPSVNDSSLRSFRSEVSTQQHTLENPPNTLSAITVSRPNSQSIELASISDLDRRPDGAEQTECGDQGEFCDEGNSNPLDLRTGRSETPLATTFGKENRKSASDKSDGADPKNRISGTSRTSRSSVSGSSLGPVEDNEDHRKDDLLDTQPFLRRETQPGPEVKSDPPSKIPKRRKKGSRRRLDDDLRDEEIDEVKSKPDEKLLSEAVSDNTEEQQYTSF